MSERFVKDFITRFLENNFSKSTVLKFRYWFTKNANDTEIENAMSELWEESPSQITQQTWEDLARLQKEISIKELEPPKIKPIYKIIFRYAAVVSLLLSTSIATYFIVQPKEIEYSEYSVPHGGQQKITLADGSTVCINAGSTLIYPKEFISKTRTVFLTGEAIFQVTRDPNKPFIVKTNHISVRALGTKFNVQSYPNLEHTTATLMEGKIRINDKYQKKSYDLVPNQQLVFNNGDHKVVVKNVDAEKISLWENGYLIFQGTAFSEIISTVERKYNVQVDYDEEQYRNCYCYVKFSPKETIVDVMSVLCTITKKAKYEIHNNKVLILSKSE